MKKVVLFLAFIALVAVGFSETPTKPAGKNYITNLRATGPKKLKANTLTVQWNDKLPKGTLIYLSICDAKDPLSVQNTQWVATSRVPVTKDITSFEFPLKKELLPKDIKRGSLVTIRMMTVLPTTATGQSTLGPIAVSRAFTLM